MDDGCSWIGQERRDTEGDRRVHSLCELKPPDARPKGSCWQFICPIGLLAATRDLISPSRGRDFVELNQSPSQAYAIAAPPEQRGFLGER
jgi:hypothetical protein